MKYISALLSKLIPTKVLLSVLLAAVLLFTSACSNSAPVKDSASMMSSPSGNSSLTKGTVQLNEIEKKAEKAINSPADSLETIVERSKGSLNEVQSGAADSNKMITSSDTKLPVVKQAEKAISDMKKG